MGIFDGKTAIITGGGKAKSIGYGIATAYAKEGANIVITGRNEQKLLDAKEELERLYNVKVLPVQADVSPAEDSFDRVKEVVQKTIEAFGRIDVLINNAQASASGVPLAEHTKEQFDLGIYSGLYATFYYMQACYPYLKAMTSQLENFKVAYPEAYEKNLKAVPMGRFGDPEKDIGRVCVLLGSEDFKYMSGETITLEGGMGQRP